MSAALASLELGLLAASGFALLTSAYLALAWPWLRERLASLPPAQRARGLWLAAVAPVALPALLVALCFVPGLLAAAGLGHDHCLQHPDHAHLCLLHASLPFSLAGGALVALATGLLAAALAPELVNLVRERRWRAGLPRGSSRLAPDVEIVASQTPFAFVSGLLRPRVHVAAKLVEALPAEQLAAVVEHERAHARRRDPLARLVARVLSRAHLPRIRRALLAELALASEAACDAEAGRRVGDRLAVAEAILAVERLLASARPAPAQARAHGVGFDGDAVGERVRALLALEPPAPSRYLLPASLALAGAAAVVGIAPLHHLTEHLLAFVSRLL